MTSSDPKEIELKFGYDKKLEKDADAWLKKGVRDNDRGIARDVEKMSFEHGFIAERDLRHYDPTDDWSTSDSVFALPLSPGDADIIEQTICADVDDGNTRARNPAMLERQALRRHTGDADGWGSDYEAEIPALGDNGDRKRCTKCGRNKTLDQFSPDSRNRDQLHSWCKECRKELTSQKRADKSK